LKTEINSENNRIIFILDGQRLILGTSEERVRLLKSGIDRKTLKKLFIEYNRLHIIKNPILFNFNDALRSCKKPIGTKEAELEKACLRNNNLPITMLAVLF
jgi:hypothetical protein